MVHIILMVIPMEKPMIAYSAEADIISLFVGSTGNFEIIRRTNEIQKN